MIEQARQGNHFLGMAPIRQKQDYIAATNPTKIAMNRLDRMQKV